MENQLKERCSTKACYGTGEWSANSGICGNCKLQEECGKMHGKIKVKRLSK